MRWISFAQPPTSSPHFRQTRVCTAAVRSFRASLTVKTCLVLFLTTDSTLLYSFGSHSRLSSSHAFGLNALRFMHFDFKVTHTGSRRPIGSLVDTDSFQFSYKTSQHTIVGSFFQLACKGVKYDSRQRKKPWVPCNLCRTAFIFPSSPTRDHFQNQRTVLFISKTNNAKCYH